MIDVAKYVPTRSGNQFAHSAQERMIRRNPTARTNDSKMTALTRTIRTCSQYQCGVVICVLLSPAAMENENDDRNDISNDDVG